MKNKYYVLNKEIISLPYSCKGLQLYKIFDNQDDANAYVKDMYNKYSVTYPNKDELIILEVPWK